MKNHLLTIALSALCVSASAAVTSPSLQSFTDYTNAVNARALSTGRHWQGYATNKADKAQSRVISQPDGKIGPSSSWGSMYTPDGQEWMYTAEFQTEMVSDWSSTITAAEFTIYDSNFNKYSSFTAQFTLGEGETTINSVQLAPTLSRKFFNINDAYEVMLYVHATTEDYTGHSYTQVYTLSDGSLVTTIEGNNIGAVNTATDSWSENFTMVFMREEYITLPPKEDEEYPTDKYLIYFDIFSKAGWGGSCNLEHTFDVDFELISGAGNYALPLLINSYKGKLYYALPSYEKPYFVSSWSEDITPDNHFIIDLYDQNFNRINTTSIPMQVEEGALFSFPGMGELYGNEDLCFGVFSDDDFPAYIIGMENYIGSTDEFCTSIYVYNHKGELIKTLVENADDYIRMSDVAGQDDQWCYLFTTDDGGSYTMIDFPTGTVRANINIARDGSYVSNAIDRVAVGNTYQYASSMMHADVDAADNVYHKMVWFDANGQFDRYDAINLGKKVAMAQPYVSAEAFTPYLFNTDDKYEYMFLVKEYESEESSRSTEYLRIYNDDSQLLLELGPDAETGRALNTIFLFNLGTSNPKMIVTYYGNDLFDITHYNLPLEAFSGGEGTAENPYMIATPGDLMAIHTASSAHYRLAADIDFGNATFSTNNCSFSGTIDGCGHTISNVEFTNGGIFAQLSDKALFTDLKFENVTFNITNGGSAGIIANETASNSDNGPTISNITVNNLKAYGSGDANFGALVGRASLHTNTCLCNITDVDINLPNATVGGVYGMATTGSAIDATAVRGDIKGHEAGGLIGLTLTGDEKVNNCHASVNIVGFESAGGIIGSSNRSITTHCIVDGSVTAIGTRFAYAGGLIGWLKPSYDDKGDFIVNHNIVSAEVSANTEATSQHVAHRVVGFSSGDEKLVDWDSTDPSVDWSDPSTYPYINGAPERWLDNNYAYDISVIDPQTEDSKTSPEGKTITGDQLTADFYSLQGWRFGNSQSAPWKEGGKLIILYFEDGKTVGVNSITNEIANKTIKFDGVCVSAQNTAIEIYNTAGICVAKGINSVNVERLPRGIYVARTAHDTLKFAK